MANDSLWEEYKNKWSVTLSPNVCTPAFFPSRWNDFKVWFHVRYKLLENQTSNNNTQVKDNFTITARGSYNGNKLAIMELILFVFVKYQSHVNFCYFKTERLPPFKYHYFENITSVISKDNIKTNHGRSLESGCILLECHVLTAGHFRSMSSNFLFESSLSSHSSLLNDFASIYESKADSDFEIHIDDKILSAHKFILKAHSPVFKKMIEHDFSESSTNSLTITDATYDVFECFLKYLYSGNIPDELQENAEDLFVLADKYDVVGPMKQDCVRIMASNLDLNNVCKILSFASVTNDDAIKQLATTFAVKNYNELKSMQEWRDLVKCHCHIGYAVVEKVCSELQGLLVK